MSSNWTSEQLEAITASGCSLLVAAAAGAGKTTVLVERIIKKITDSQKPIDIDRLLVVTFTNAAATQMRERIGAAIASKMEKGNDSKRLQSQMTLLNRASITTIHSFCLEVIKSNFHFTDLDPGFRIADETEATLLKLEALDELFEECYETSEEYDRYEDFLNLVECYGGSRDDKQLSDMVLNLYNFVQSHPWPEKWLKNAAEAFNINSVEQLESSLWIKNIKYSLQLELQGLIDIAEKALELLYHYDGFDTYIACLKEDKENLKELLKKCSCSWDEIYKAFQNYEFSTLKRCSKDADKDIQEKAKSMREKIKNKIKNIASNILYCDSESLTKSFRELYPLMCCLCDLVLRFEKKYSAKKREKNLIDFNDIEHYCLKILTEKDEQGNIKPSKAAYDYREKFEEILIDEYQDSNEVQEVILTTISRKDLEEPNLFMVGDVKQSIYRFRQANPNLFTAKYETYSDSKEAKERKIQLFSNFRSRKEIIDGVNFIFTQIMSKTVGELDYDEKEMLIAGAEYPVLEDGEKEAGGPIEVNIIDMGNDIPDAAYYDEAGEDAEGEYNVEDAEDLDNIKAEATLAVRRINELVNAAEGKPFVVYDSEKKCYRKAEYRDIVILMRATKNWADVFVEEFSKAGIPAFADTGGGYFDTVEIRTMMSLLQIIDNPMQDIPMLAVLRSPVGGFSAEELIDIRLADKHLSIYEAMKKAAEGSGELSGKIKAFLENLNRWRKKARYTPTDELIWSLYNDTGYYAYAGAMPGGVQRQANLRVLFERARQYEETSYKGLFNFINFIGKLRSSSGDMGSAKIIGENENVVRIMSIHKSKGLEFPVVIMAGAGKQFNMQDMRKSILMHQDLGFGPDYVNPELRLSYPTICKQALMKKIRLENLSEEMRILYVAFTRAKEKLIITGSVKKLEKSLNKWASHFGSTDEKLPEHTMYSAGSYLDWVCPALMRHPSASTLRNRADIEIYDEVAAEGESSRWEVRLWTKGDIQKFKEQQQNEHRKFMEELIKTEEDEKTLQYKEDVDKRLSWEYPYVLASKLPTKLSVTEMKRIYNTEFSEEFSSPIFIPPVRKAPSFLEDKKDISAAERGTILHFVMQHLNLKNVRSKEDIKDQIEQMIEKELLTRNQAQAVDIQKILRFFNSDLGRRMIRSNRVEREIPFNLEFACTEIYREIPGDIYEKEKILVQGVIDCFFEEDEGIVLLDYKTDYIPPEGKSVLAEKYKQQIECYARAINTLTGKKVIGKYIYLFYNGEVIEY